jgi:hypothetical protein
MMLSVRIAPAIKVGFRSEFAAAGWIPLTFRVKSDLPRDDHLCMVSASLLRGHLVHLVIFGLSVAGLVGAVGLQELRARCRGHSGRVVAGISDTDPDHLRFEGRSLWLRVGAAGLVGAAAIHVFVIPEHFREYMLYGFFFCALTALQVSLAVLLIVRPDARLVRYVAVGSAWVVVLYFVSRTSGVPIGPEPWHAEAFGGLDVAATSAELATVAGCAIQLWMARDRHPRTARRLVELVR